MEKGEAYWHSPHETVNGETTLSPMRSVEYSSCLPIAAEWKLEPSAMTSPMSSCPQVRLLSALVKGSPGTKSDADVLAVDVLMSAINMEVAPA